MRAMTISAHGDIEQLDYTYVDVPKPGPHDVLIKVRACALNHLDLWTLQGPPGVKIPFPHIMGADIAGEVAETGSKVHGLPRNRPVVVYPGISCGTCSFCETGWDSLCPQYKIIGFQIDGGFAQYVKVPAKNVLLASRKLSFEEWAAAPLVFLTAWHMLVTRANLKKGETVLIHAAGSGIGSAAIRLAKYLGAKVITTAGTDEKVRKAKALGADEVIPHHKKNFSEETLKITEGKGADVVLEHIGPATFSGSIASLAKKGRLVTCGASTGPIGQLDLRYLFLRQISVMGCYMGSLKEMREVIRLIRHKKILPVVDKVYALRDAPAAFRRMQARAQFGKIILVPG